MSHSTELPHRQRQIPDLIQNFPISTKEGQSEDLVQVGTFRVMIRTIIVLLAAL